MTTLQELCEPLFLYVCRLNRMMRKGVTPEYGQARVEIQTLLDDMRDKADAEPGLAAEYAKVELALVFFVDSLIARSSVPFAQQWHENRLAYERNELTGDQEFFTIFDRTLAERGQAALDRLQVLYSCIGLGFTGYLANQPESLRTRMNEAAAKLARRMASDDATRLCQQAYEHTDRRQMAAAPGIRIGAIVIATIGLLLLVVVANYFAYQFGSSDLEESLKELEDLPYPTDEASS